MLGQEFYPVSKFVGSVAACTYPRLGAPISLNRLTLTKTSFYGVIP